MRNYVSILSRRRFCEGLATVAGNFALATVFVGIRPGSKIPLDDDFLIVNGWVLTRKDVEAEVDVI